MSFSPVWLETVRKKVVIVPDAEGDDEYARKLAAQLGWRGSILRLPYDEKTKDPADYLAQEAGGGGREEITRLLAKYV